MRTIYFLLTAISLVACSSQYSSKDEDPSISMSASQSDFLTPESSKLESINFENPAIDENDIFKIYLQEKEAFRDELHFENTMNMWHHKLRNSLPNLTNANKEILLNDMLERRINLIALSTFYDLIDHKNLFRSEQVKIKTETEFYDKNMKFLESKTWKREDLRKQKIEELTQLHSKFLAQ